MSIHSCSSSSQSYRFWYTYGFEGLSGFNKPVLKFATSWFKGDKSSTLRCFFPVSFMLHLSISVILSQSQHFTNLWHNDKYWFSLQRDSMCKTILFKLIYNFSKTINYYIYHLQDANCVLGYFSTVSHSMHQNWYKTWQINFWPFLFGFYIFLSFFFTLTW